MRSPDSGTASAVGGFVRAGAVLAGQAALRQYVNRVNMKKILIAVGVAAAIGGVLLMVALIKFVHVIHEAEGRALYSSVGAWTRIQEFAHASGKTNYIVFADSQLAMLQHQLNGWQQNARQADLSSFEKLQVTAYATTDKNIKNGLNPLAYLDAQNAAPQPAGMTPSLSTNR